MDKHDLVIDPPLMNAAGSLGFSPDTHGPVAWSKMGAFITNPVSLEARTPAHGQRFAEFHGGFLLHTGYPNPGIHGIIRRYASQWRRSPLQVFVHILARHPSEVESMVRRLEVVEGVMGLEVGVDSHASMDLAAALTRAAYGELPVIVRLPMEQAPELAPVVVEAGAAAISLAPPRGAYPDANGALTQGRLYGPAVFPVALRLVDDLSRTGVPVIGAGGVYTRQHAEAMLAVGALAVQLDSVLWRGGHHMFE